MDFDNQCSKSHDTRHYKGIDDKCISAFPFYLSEHCKNKDYSCYYTENEQHCSEQIL
ncbi:hypothetical protein [Ruminococcus sp.]|uniref:hypothetical protein n=1 Tax=Ruminococcus sp. TaxID=41978 RepID=UPI0025E29E15|nr:hypothetical protein [Ruminococcus sp.]